MDAVAFGKYQLIEPLAEGGMAVVWRARLVGPGGFHKDFCLKQVRSELAERPEFVDMFVAEAKLTVSLTHANIVPVYELGMVDGTYFLALELIDGPSLAKLSKAGALPAALSAYVVEQVLRGLDYAHRRNVVHRDLSAANVLVSRDGEVKIVDFGIAAPVDGRGVHGGSRGYMAPEQEQNGRADARSDLYAVGVLLWELLAGRRYQPGPLPEGVPEALAAIITRATAPAPEERYPDAAAMLAQVSRFLRDLSMGPTQAELSSWVRRHCPDVPRGRSTGAHGADASRATGPRTVPVERNESRATGPRTVPVDPTRSTGRTVTFATRIEAEKAGTARARSGRRSAALMGIGIGLALAAAGGLWLRRATLALAPVPSPSPSGEMPLGGPPRPIVNGAATPGAVRAETGDRRQATGDGRWTEGMAEAAGTAGARVSVRTVPAGAEVRLGDKVLGVTPLEVEVPAAGPLELHLRKRGYQPIDRTLKAAAQVTVSERMAPLGRGELTLNALPWAHVTIDGEKRPDTPIQKLALAAGAHQVRLVCPPTGHELKFTVVVEPDAEVRRLADLRSEPRLIE